MRECGWNCLKYCKMRQNRKEERGNKYFKKGGKLGQGVVTLKRGCRWGWSPLMNYECFFLVSIYQGMKFIKPLLWWLWIFWIIINFQILWKTNIVFYIWKTTCWKSWGASLYEFHEVRILDSRACRAHSKCFLFHLFISA